MKVEVGKRIEGIRKEMKLTKEKLARQIGVSGQFFGMVEKGKSSLSYEKLEKLCNMGMLRIYWYINKFIVMRCFDADTNS